MAFSERQRYVEGNIIRIPDYFIGTVIKIIKPNKTVYKENFNFISLIRLPDFVTKADFDWAIEEATRKKKEDFSKVEFLTYNEGVCVQCMHIGSFDDEPKTVSIMHEFMKENGYESDIRESRYHHEIYLSDPRKCSAEKLKTVIRIPVKKV